MRIAYLPVISARNVQAAPSYNWWLALREHWLKADPNAVFYILVPRTGEDTRWKEGGDWSGPRTHVIEIDMYESQFNDLALVTKDVFDRFNENFGDLYFDVMITERPQTVPILRKLLQHPIVSKSRRPVIVCRDQITLNTEWFKIDPIEEALQAVGWTSAPTAFQSPHQAKLALRVAAKHLQPAHVNRMAEQTRVFPLGIDCDDIDQINGTEREGKNDQITVNYSHKLFIEQKFLESLTIMDSTFAGGRDVRLQVVTGSSAGKFHMLPRARKFAYMEIHGGQNRHQFLRQMAKAHVFISNSYYEDFSATVAEQIYSGLIPVLADEDWSRYLVGDDYPYLFQSMQEGQAMMRYVVDNYETVRDSVVPGLQQRCREMFDLKTIVPQMIDWITDLHDARMGNLKQASGSLRDVIQQAYEILPDEFGLPDFYAAIKEKAEALDVTKQGTESRATSPWLCVDVLRSLHPTLVDTGDLHARFRSA